MAQQLLPRAFEWCSERLDSDGKGLGLGKLKMWQMVGVCKAGVYVTNQRKGSKSTDLEPAAVEAYGGFCKTFERVFGVRESVVPEYLPRKSMNANKSEACLDGKTIWRRYKDFKTWFLLLSFFSFF